MAISNTELVALAQPDSNIDEVLASFNVSNLDDVAVNEQSVNRLARGVSTGTVAETKDNTRRTDVPIALSGATWDQPLSPYNASYPHNRVMKTKNGHVQEFDDTPGNQRYHRYHPSGSFVECDSEGNEVRKIVGDKFSIIEKDGNVFIAGNCNITVEGSCNIRVMNNCNLEVDGSLRANIKNDIDMIASGCFNLNVKETFKIRADNMLIETTKFNHKNIGPMVYETNTLDTTVLDAHTSKATTYGLKTIGSSTFNSGENFNIKSTGKTTFNAGDEFQVTASKLAVETNLHVKDNLFVESEVHSPLFKGVARYAQYAVTAGQAPLGAPSPTDPNRTAPSIDNGVIETIVDPTVVLSTGLIIPDERANVREVNISRAPPNTRATKFAVENDDVSVGSAALYPGYSSPAPYVPDEAMTRSFVPGGTGKALEQDPGSLAKKQPVAVPNLIQTSAPSTMISRYFTLADLSLRATFPHQIRAQAGLTDVQIAQNLQYLATNILDPIVDQYGRQAFIITSGFRPAQQAKGGSNLSQHSLGQAVDIQFLDIQADYYPNRANELIRLLPFDQLLLEYQSGGTGKPWIHISYSKNKLKYQYATFYNHKVVSPPGFLTV